MKEVSQLILEALNTPDSRWVSAVRRFKAAAEKKAHYRRACGDCTECCTTMGVHEIKKPPGKPCWHLVGRGCGIYETRPASCKSYECLWLSGITPDGWQPKKYGIVMDISRIDPKSTSTDLKDYGFFLRETKSSAFVAHPEKYAQSIALAAVLCLSTPNIRHIGVHHWLAKSCMVFKVTLEGGTAQLELLKALPA